MKEIKKNPHIVESTLRDPLKRADSFTNETSTRIYKEFDSGNNKYIYFYFSNIVGHNS